MAIDINVHISAEPALVEALKAIADAVAINQITKANDLTVYCKPQSNPAAPKKDKHINCTNKEENVALESQAQPEEKKQEALEHNPDEIVDEKLLPSIRKTVATFCSKYSDGKETVRIWLKENGYAGLAKLTYKGVEDFTAFLESEVKKSA